MSNGVQTLWDTNQNNCYYWARQQNGYLQTNNWANLVLDGQEQIWTILFNLNPPNSSRTASIWQKFNASFPNWISQYVYPAGGSPEPGSAFALVSDRMQGGISSAYVPALVSAFETANFPWPFTPDAAAQLLAIPPTFINIQVQPGGAVSLTYSGIPAVQYYLKQSSDLVHWTNLSTNLLSTNGNATITDANTSSGAKYYRVGTSP